MPGGRAPRRASPGARGSRRRRPSRAAPRRSRPEGGRRGRASGRRGRAGARACGQHPPAPQAREPGAPVRCRSERCELTAARGFLMLRIPKNPQRGGPGRRGGGPMIEARHLSKRYGDVVAVQDVSFEVGRGEVVGFLGPNGAGKTTTMRMLTGFLPPTDGTAVIAGHDIFSDPLAARRAIGYLPEVLPLYPEMSVRSYLDYVARIKDVPRRSRRGCVDRALERCGLANQDRHVIGTLSKGYRQRVGLAQAIVHDPAVLILDEPTVGLDPLQVREIRNLIPDPTRKT